MNGDDFGAGDRRCTACPFDGGQAVGRAVYTNDDSFELHSYPPATAWFGFMIRRPVVGADDTFMSVCKAATAIYPPSSHGRGHYPDEMNLRRGGPWARCQTGGPVPALGTVKRRDVMGATV
jgi:hypothetical protein